MLKRLQCASAIIFILSSFLCVHAWWDDHCSEGGQCAAMIKSYENLITGEGCRSFYATGKCTRICTYSLKSLIGRHTWTKCAERCDWSTAVIAGASSWLDMCLSHPAKDVFQSEEDADQPAGPDSIYAAKPSLKDSRDASSVEGNLNTPPSQSRVVLLSIFVAVGVVVAIAIVLMKKSAMHGSLDSSSRQLMSWLRRVQGKQYYGGKTESGKGPLDVGPDRKELRHLQRGARRHLKAMRATLD